MSLLCPVSPLQMFESNRVKFYMQTEVSELREQEGKVGCGQGPQQPPRAAVHFASEVLLSTLSYPLKFLSKDLAPRSKHTPDTVCEAVSLLPPSSCCRYRELWSTCMSKINRAASLACYCCRVLCPQNNCGVPLCAVQLKEVVLKSGKVLRADVCVVGVGKGPSLRWGFAWRGEAGGDAAALEPPPQNATENIFGK